MKAQQIIESNVQIHLENGFKHKELLNSINKLRDCLTALRNKPQVKYVGYRVYFSKGTFVLSQDDKFKTEQNSFFNVKLDPISLYPELDSQGKNPYKIQYKRPNQKGEKVSFNPCYNATPDQKGYQRCKYCVTNIIGVLVAQQIRFNTLQIPFEYQNGVPKQLFDGLFKRYYRKYYNQWKQLSKSDKVNIVHQDGVRILLPHLEQKKIK